jgi:hypothetical protein
VAASLLLTASSFLTVRIKLLHYLWIDRVFLLGKGRQGKADGQSYKGK